MAEHSEKTMDSKKTYQTSEKPYECKYCERKFSIRQSHLTHERWHTEEKPYHCNHCEECFRSTKELKCHKLIHKGENSFKENDQYQCNSCEQSFKTKAFLRKHLSIHIGKDIKTSHECKHCKKTFLKLSNLNIHMKIHVLSSKKPSLYPCSQCVNTFTSNDDLKKHMKKHTVLKESRKSSLCNKANQDNSLNNSALKKTIHMNRLMTHTNSRGIWVGKVKQSHKKTTDLSSNQKSKVKNHINSDGISTNEQSSLPLFCDDSAKVILWFQQNKLLKCVWSCDSCYNLMNWSDTSIIKDRYEWTCRTKSCIMYEQGVCIKLGSFFENSLVTLPDWFDIMYLWSENVKAKVSSDLVNISHEQIMDCYASFREVCWEYFVENPINLGGPGTIIEFDVTSFLRISENNQDKSPIMVLSIIDSNSKPLNGYLEIVESSNAATLLPKLLNVVKPGSIIYTKDSKEYRKLQGIAEIDTIDNHTINFLDINTSDYVTNMESFWDKHRDSINEILDYKEMDQNSYLQEFMWRDRFYSDSFNKLCHQISEQYPL